MLTVAHPGHRYSSEPVASGLFAQTLGRVHPSVGIHVAGRASGQVEVHGPSKASGAALKATDQRDCRSPPG